MAGGAVTFRVQGNIWLEAMRKLGTPAIEIEEGRNSGAGVAGTDENVLRGEDHSMDTKSLEEQRLGHG
jgi:hypothetical protein